MLYHKAYAPLLLRLLNDVERNAGRAALRLIMTSLMIDKQSMQTKI